MTTFDEPTINSTEPDSNPAGSLAPYMDIRETVRTAGYTSVTGRIRPPLAVTIPRIKRFLGNFGYYAAFDKRGPEHVVRFGFPQARPSPPPRRWINLLLFVATVFTTTTVGSFQQNGNPFLHPLDLLKGIPFSFSLIMILGSHELGHYFFGKRSGVETSLPYFLPVPHPLIGTMGAFIRIRSIIPDRNALVRLGIAGPLTGFVFALPITVVGLALSRVQPASAGAAGLGLGNSILFGLLAKIIFPRIPAHYDIFLHPTAFAGWLGLFVTALNLLPIGQLDGGHVAYGVFGRFRLFATVVVIVLLAGLGFLWPGWWVWGVLALLLGFRHPAPQDALSPLGTREKVLALVGFVILVLCFTPVPFSFRGP